MSKESIPTDYFKNLKSKILNDVQSLEDELELNAPTLFKLKNKNSYRTPVNYFDNNVFKSPSTNLKRRSARVLYLKIGSIAATLLILISVFWQLNKTTLPEMTLAENEIIDYYLNNDNDIDSEFLLTMTEDYNSDLEAELTNISDEELNIYIESILDDLDINDFATIDN